MTSLSKEVDVIPSLYKNVSDSEAPKRRARSEENQLYKDESETDSVGDDVNPDKLNYKELGWFGLDTDSENSTEGVESDFLRPVWENERNEKTESQTLDDKWLESEIESFCNDMDRQLGEPINVSNSNNIIYPNTSSGNLEERLDSKNQMLYPSNTKKTKESVNQSLAAHQGGVNGFIGNSWSCSICKYLKTGACGLEKFNYYSKERSQFPRRKQLLFKQLRELFKKKKPKDKLIEKIMDKSSIEKLKNHSELYKINYMSLLERYNQVKRAHSMVVPRMQMVEIQNKILFEIMSKIYSDDERNLDLLKEFIGKLKSHENLQKSSHLGENYVNILNNVINANSTSEIRPWAKVLSGMFNHYDMKVDETLIHNLNTLYSINKMAQGI
uniref:Uncharacterized protein n=1 Tax=Theileria parva TaxID=5875 RepID=Q4N2Y2_THEPA|eukprot:XP_763845.1 hypothetical protein [Theileria parva strain Muguga]